MITCQDILELHLDGVELIAGEKGLTRPVTWTYMVQTRPFEEHMNQGNFALCVVDYVRFDLEEAQKAMEELYRLGISGFGVSITDDKESVPKEMIDKANALQLPLFYIRWKGASFVDIAQSVGKSSWNMKCRTGGWEIIFTIFCLAMILMTAISKKSPSSSGSTLQHPAE